jgi:hypothetical protein
MTLGAQAEHLVDAQVVRREAVQAAVLATAVAVAAGALAAVQLRATPLWHSGRKSSIRPR